MRTLDRRDFLELSGDPLDSRELSDRHGSAIRTHMDLSSMHMALTSFRDAFASHRVIAAADRSAAEGRPVKLAEIAEE